MFNDYLEREDVKELLKQIFTNPKYYKKISEDELSNKYVLHEEVLFIFYSALYKFKLLIDDDFFLDQYIKNFELLLKRLDKIEDIKYGLSKLLGKLVEEKLILPDGRNDKVILNYIYNKYVVSGFYIKGISKLEYNNNDLLNESFDSIKAILNNYNYQIESNNNTFNTDIMKACFNSINSPDILYNLVCYDKNINRNIYYLKDYDACIKSFNKLLSNLEVNSSDKNILNDLFNSIWNSYNDRSNNIYLSFVKRADVKEIDEFVENNSFTFEEALYNIFTVYEDSIESVSDYNVYGYMELPLYSSYIKEKTDDKVEIVDNVLKGNNKISYILLIVGTILILMGVIFTFINF